MVDHLVRLLNRFRRHSVLSVFCLALAVRFLVAGIVATFFEGSLFLDDRTYLQMAEALNLGGASRDNVVLWEGWDDGRGFLVPIAFLLDKLGALPLAAQLIPVVAGSVTAAAVTMLLRRHTTSTVALGAGILAAVFPSQVLWSSLILKDALVWMSLSLTAVALAWWAERESKQGFAIGAIVVTTLAAYLSILRPHTLVVCCIAMVISTGWRKGRWRIQFIAVTAALLIVVPWVAGSGIAGFDIVRLGASGLEQQREAAATGGARAFGDAVTIEAWRDVLYLPTGLRTMLIDPLPHHLGESTRIVFAFAENIIWYPLLALAVYGMPAIRRRNLELTLTLLLLIGLTIMWALIEGNFGTAFRHRGEFVWAVIVLAGVGADRLLASWPKRHDLGQSPGHA